MISVGKKSLLLALSCVLAALAPGVAHATVALDDPLAPLVSIAASPALGIAGPRTITISVLDRGGSGISSTHYSVGLSEETTYTTRFVLSRPASYPVRAWSEANDGRVGIATATVDVTTDSAVRSTPIQGLDRIWTAIEGSRKAFKDALAPDSEGHRTVVLATAYNWPDALGASTLAGAVGGPVLLTTADVLPTHVAAEMVRLGVDRVVIIGGPKAVSAAVEQTLFSVPGVEDVERIAGNDRYATAAHVAERSVGLLGPRFSGTLFAATGHDFPDALGASAVAAARGCPLYLIPPGDTVRTDLADSIRAVGCEQPVVLGGERAMNARVVSDLGKVTGHAPVRLAGDDRYETALDVAEWAVANHLLYWDGAALVTGLGYADAVSGGAVQGHNLSVLLLTDPETLTPAVEDAIRAHNDYIAELRFLGGEAALSLAVRDSALAAAAK